MFRRRKSDKALYRRIGIWTEKEPFTHTSFESIVNSSKTLFLATVISKLHAISLVVYECRSKLKIT